MPVSSDLAFDPSISEGDSGDVPQRLEKQDAEFVTIHTNEERPKLARHYRRTPQRK
jgi:hypothetical protein